MLLTLNIISHIQSVSPAKKTVNQKLVTYESFLWLSVKNINWLIIDWSVKYIDWPQKNLYIYIYIYIYYSAIHLESNNFHQLCCFSDSFVTADWSVKNWLITQFFDWDTVKTFWESVNNTVFLKLFLHAEIHNKSCSIIEEFCILCGLW